MPIKEDYLGNFRELTSYDFKGKSTAALRGHVKKNIYLVPKT